jgi:hypothetical protein
MKKPWFSLSLLFLSYFVGAQAFLRPNEWKKYRREVFVTMGAANFLGDLGGRDKIGKDYSPADLDFAQSRTAAGFGARYKLDKLINVAAKFSYLHVKGDDSRTNEPFRNNRNLNFKSNIFEISARIEGGYQTTKRGSNRYGITKNYGKMKNITHSVFGFIGIGGFYFNPKGRNINGVYVPLKPLHTEGQGLPGGPKNYSRFSASIPVGGYYKLTLNKKWSFGIEFSYRKTFTDYIDDVSTFYYDPVALEKAYGPTAVYMADPSLGKNYPDRGIKGATSPDAAGNPAQRGDRQKDVFMSLELTGSYIFKQQRRSARLRSKF